MQRLRQATKHRASESLHAIWQLHRSANCYIKLKLHVVDSILAPTTGSENTFTGTNVVVTFANESLSCCTGADILINPTNEGLIGAQLSYFPIGGLPTTKGSKKPTHVLCKIPTHVLSKSCC
jgi:hypothetical protein